MSKPHDNVKDLWQRCMDGIKHKLDGTDDALAFAVVFRTLRPYTEEGVLILDAPNTHIAARLQEPDLADIVRGVVPKEVSKIRVVVGYVPRPSAAPNENPAAVVTAPQTALPAPTRRRAKIEEVDQNQLPKPWPDQWRAISSDLVRTALFTANRYGLDTARPQRKRVQVVAQEGTVLYVSGEETNTFDESVFIQLLHYQREQPVGARVHFSLRELAGDLGKSPTGPLLEQLKRAIDRLQQTRLELEVHIKGIPSRGFKGQMIGGFAYDKTIDLWAVSFNPDILAMFAVDARTYISWSHDKGLRKDLSKRLHRIYSSHSPQVYPMKVATLYKLTGSTIKEMYKFRQALRESHEELTEKGFLSSWKIDASDKVHVVKTNDTLFIPPSSDKEVE